MNGDGDNNKKPKNLKTRVAMFKNMSGNIPGGNFLGGNFPGGRLMGGNFPGESFPDTVLAIPLYWKDMFDPYYIKGVQKQ